MASVPISAARADDDGSPSQARFATKSPLEAHVREANAARNARTLRALVGE